jgi:hypothetical protein
MSIWKYLCLSRDSAHSIFWPKDPFLYAQALGRQNGLGDQHPRETPQDLNKEEVTPDYYVG